jgi:hypothetical protein
MRHRWSGRPGFERAETRGENDHDDARATWHHGLASWRIVQKWAVSASPGSPRYWMIHWGTRPGSYHD